MAAQPPTQRTPSAIFFLRALGLIRVSSFAGHRRAPLERNIILSTARHRGRRPLIALTSSGWSAAASAPRPLRPRGSLGCLNLSMPECSLGRLGGLSHASILYQSASYPARLYSYRVCTGSLARCRIRRQGRAPNRKLQICEYQELSNNPANDVNALSPIFRKIGFDVKVGIDLSYVEMRRALRQFADLSAKGDIAVIYFAGHGTRAWRRELSDSGRCQT